MRLPIISPYHFSHDDARRGGGPGGGGDVDLSPTMETEFGGDADEWGNGRSTRTGARATVWAEEEDVVGGGADGGR